MKKILYSVLGFGLGAFMLFNSTMCFYRFKYGHDVVLTSQEWLTSCIVTLSVGLTLIFFTQKIIKQS